MSILLCNVEIVLLSSPSNILYCSRKDKYKECMEAKCRKTFSKNLVYWFHALTYSIFCQIRLDTKKLKNNQCFKKDAYKFKYPLRMLHCGTGVLDWLCLRQSVRRTVSRSLSRSVGLLDLTLSGGKVYIECKDELLWTLLSSPIYIYIYIYIYYSV